MDVRLPNGTILKNVPEGTSKDEIATKAIKAGLATPQEMFNPTEGMSGVDKFLAGMGAGSATLGSGSSVPVAVAVAGGSAGCCCGG